jgi:hypothetical protein
MKALQAGLVAALTMGAVGLAAMTTATTGCSTTSQVRQIFMALDGTGDRTRDTFYPDTTQIFCDVVWAGRSPDTTIDAVIVQTKGEDIIGSGSVVPVDRLFAVGEVVGGENLSTLSFTWTVQADGGGTAPFPVGSYQCQVSVNGENAGASNFFITYPGCAKNDPTSCGGAGTDCPLGGAAVPGAPCLGFYKIGAQCPSIGDLTNASGCNCDGASGVWQCQ